jgi:hypothetical protein
MFIHFHIYDVLIYFKSYDKISLIIKVHVIFFVYMNHNEEKRCFVIGLATQFLGCIKHLQLIFIYHEC